MDSLHTQIGEIAASMETFRQATQRLQACRVSLGEVRWERLTAEIQALGADAVAGLRSKRKQLSKEAEAARALSNQAASNQALADERTGRARSALEVARAAHDGALAALPEGVGAALTAAQAALGT